MLSLTRSRDYFSWLLLLFLGFIFGLFSSFFFAIALLLLDDDKCANANQSNNNDNRNDDVCAKTNASLVVNYNRCRSGSGFILDYRSRSRSAFFRRILQLNTTVTVLPAGIVPTLMTAEPADADSRVPFFTFVITPLKLFWSCSVAST